MAAKYPGQSSYLYAAGHGLRMSIFDCLKSPESDYVRG
jgi:hypothetical protein